jgi:hypothetical protein
MNAKPKLSAFLWSSYLIASLLTLLVYETAWEVRSYWMLLSLCGLLSSILAVKIVVHTGLRLWPILLVSLGLVVGQWWFIKFITVQILWSIKGFAP